MLDYRLVHFIGCDDNGLNGEDVAPYSFLIAGKSKRFRSGFECVDGEYIPVDYRVVVSVSNLKQYSI